MFPHYMGRENSFTSTSVLGSIYDTVSSYQAEDPSMKGENYGYLQLFLSHMLCRPMYAIREWNMTESNF